LSIDLLRLVLIAVASDLSYRFVEVPIRSGAIGRAFARMRASDSLDDDPATRRFLTRLSFGALVGVIAVGIAWNAQKPGDEAPVGAATNPSPTLDPEFTASVTTTPSSRGGSTASSGTTPGTGSGTTATTRPRGTTTTVPTIPASLQQQSVTMVGDSVMLGASNTGLLDDIVPGRLDVQALESRAPVNGVELIAARAEEGTLGDAVVVHLGTNGTFRSDLFEKMMDFIGDDRSVVVLNVRVPRSWEADVNSTLASETKRYDNVRLVDWHQIGNDNPGIFANDGYHIGADGAELYAAAIRDALIELSERP
jgi:hypothetical protein